MCAGSSPQVPATSGSFLGLTHSRVSLAPLHTTALVRQTRWKYNCGHVILIYFKGVFIAETAHASFRRILGPFQTITACLGCALGYTSGALLSWRTSKLVLGTLITIPAAFAILLCQETPHWLVKRGMTDEARYVRIGLTLQIILKYVCLSCGLTGNPWISTEAKTINNKRMNWMKLWSKHRAKMFQITFRVTFKYSRLAISLGRSFVLV